MIRVWYVYRHVRLDNLTPFYVGLGKEDSHGRMRRAHLKNSTCRSSEWFDVISEADYRVDVIMAGLTSEEARLKEKEFIGLYGRIDLGTGTLINKTGGGDGVWLSGHSKSTRKRLSESKIGKLNPMFGKKLSDEHKRKISETSTGSKRSDKTKINQSLSLRAAGLTKECEVMDYKTGQFIGRYYGISEACRQLGIHYMNSKAVMVANGKRNQTKGYVFRYV